MSNTASRKVDLSEQFAQFQDFAPDSLQSLCYDVITENLDIISTLDPLNGHVRQLRDDVRLPAGIADSFLEAYQKKRNLDDSVALMLGDQQKVWLQAVRVRNSQITDRGLQALMEHRPRLLELSHCDSLTQRSIEVINRNSQNLVTLRLGQLSFLQVPVNRYFRYRKKVLSARYLRRLSMDCRGMHVFPLFLHHQLGHLTHLDLTDYNIPSSLWGIHKLDKLVWLSLHGVAASPELIAWIGSLKRLQHVDISQSNDRLGQFHNPNEVMSYIVSNLPQLESLDVSGTNLAGTGSAVLSANDGASGINEARCDIPGLVSRVGKPLHFLGLYYTQHNACRRHDIPARVITGDANEAQILAAAEAYMERPAMLTRVLNDLYFHFRYENNHSIALALCVILDAMQKYLYEKHIQISGSATLFYILTGEHKAHISRKLINRIVKVLLDGMGAHISDETMMRNGCLTLCQFSIPSDVMFEYERVVRILLNGLTVLHQEAFVQRIAIYLLNSLACQVDGRQKRFLGHNGAIRKMLSLISDRVDQRICDDVLEVAWSTMWNVTDETPENCQRFLDLGGMEYFLACLRMFPDREELLRNMMGLLGNVAEVAHLRPLLMDETFLRVFNDLLDSTSDGIEVSYNAAGVLAHMASDGPDAWTVARPTRAEVLEHIDVAVLRWDRYSERNINYRSFHPILSLLKADHTPQCQLWAVWALANLTTVYPGKYCSLVMSEDGLELLNAIVNESRTCNKVKSIARVVITNCITWHLTTIAQEGADPEGSRQRKLATSNHELQLLNE